jgi:hypothetical protein
MISINVKIKHVDFSRHLENVWSLISSKIEDFSLNYVFFCLLLYAFANAVNCIG